MPSVLDYLTITKRCPRFEHFNQAIATDYKDPQRPLIVSTTEGSMVLHTFAIRDHTSPDNDRNRHSRSSTIFKRFKWLDRQEFHSGY